MGKRFTRRASIGKRIIRLKKIPLLEFTSKKQGMVSGGSAQMLLPVRINAINGANGLNNFYRLIKLLFYAKKSSKPLNFHIFAS